MNERKTEWKIIAACLHKEGEKETGTRTKTPREKDPFSLQSEIFVDFVHGMFSSLSNFP